MVMVSTNKKRRAAIPALCTALITDIQCCCAFAPTREWIKDYDTPNRQATYKKLLSYYNRMPVSGPNQWQILGVPDFTTELSFNCFIIAELALARMKDADAAETDSWRMHDK